MAEQDLPELEAEAPRDDGEELDEDNLLKPQFVNSVIDALESGDHGRAYELVEPLHPADIADLFELLEPGERDLPRRAQDPRQLAGADRLVGRIDDEDFPELGGQVVALAQVIDQVADGEVLGHRHQLALHQPPGALLGVGERAFDRRAVARLHLGEDGALVLGLEVLDQLDRVVGVELLGDVRDVAGRERLDHVLADVVVELGDDLVGHQVGDGGREPRPLLAVEQLEQVGDVGGVERLDQLVGAAFVALLDGLDDRVDEPGLQPVLLVELAFVLAGRVGFQLGEVLLAHAARSMPVGRKSKLTSVPIRLYARHDQRRLRNGR